jgi:hypothetical protein
MLLLLWLLLVLILLLLLVMGLLSHTHGAPSFPTSSSSCC